MKPLHLAHLADIHWTEKLSLAEELVLDPATGLNVRLTDVSNCVDAFTDQAAAFGVDVAIVVGDTFDRPRPTPNEERAAITGLERLQAETGGPVIVLDGNHDYPGSEQDATGTTCLWGRADIHVVDEPGYFDFYTGPTVEFYGIDEDVAEKDLTPHRRARIFVLPWTGRGPLLADEDLAELTAEQLTGLVSRKVQALVSRMRDLRAPGVPNVLAFHGTIEGCEINEQPASLQREIGLRVCDLDGFDLVVLGHVHKRQQIAVPGSRTVAWYSGSIDRANIGEQHEDKGGNLYAVTPVAGGFSVETTFAPTPARPYRTIPVEHILQGGTIDDDGRTVYRVKGSIVPERVAELRARLDGLGVRHLVRDVEVVREHVVRDVGMEGLGEEQLVRRRLAAHDVPAVEIDALMQVHNRIAARS